MFSFFLQAGFVCVPCCFPHSLFAVDCKSTYGHTDSGQRSEEELVLLTYTRREKINIRGSDVGFLAEGDGETTAAGGGKKNNYYKYI